MTARGQLVLCFSLASGVGGHAQQPAVPSGVPTQQPGTAIQTPRATAPAQAGAASLPESPSPIPQITPAPQPSSPLESLPMPLGSKQNLGPDAGDPGAAFSLPPVPRAPEMNEASRRRVSDSQRATTSGDLGGCNASTSVRASVACTRTAGQYKNEASLQATHRYTLPELIDIAEASSPEAHIAWANAKIAMERAGIARAQYLPLLSLAAQGSDLRAIVPFPKPIAPRGYVTVEEPTALAQAELQYTVIDFGRGARLESNHALEIASTLRLGRMQQTVAFHTAQNFYRTQQAIGQYEALVEIARTAQTVSENAQSQFDNGRATLPDLENAKAGLAEAQYSVASARGDVEKARLALTEAIGAEPTTELEIVPQERDSSPEVIDRTVEKFVHAAWTDRPDLLARASDLRSSERLLRAARSAYLPSVGVSAVGGETATWPTADFGQLGFAEVPTWSVAATARWQIFNGARRHEIEVAAAEHVSSEEEQRAAKDAVTREVWSAYVDFRSAAEQERSARNYFHAARTSYDSSLDAFRYGVRSLVDVIQSERQLAEARLLTVRAYSQRMQSLLSLSYATGELLHAGAATQGVKP